MKGVSEEVNEIFMTKDSLTWMTKTLLSSIYIVSTECRDMNDITRRLG